jgi:hypothetical protein
LPLGEGVHRQAAASERHHSGRRHENKPSMAPRDAHSTQTYRKQPYGVEHAGLHGRGFQESAAPPGNAPVQEADGRVLDLASRLAVGVELEMSDPSRVRAAARPAPPAMPRDAPRPWTFALTRTVTVDCREAIRAYAAGSLVRRRQSRCSFAGTGSGRCTGRRTATGSGSTSRRTGAVRRTRRWSRGPCA